PLLDFYACTFSLLFCQSFFTHPDLHSFPTRRSSDLGDLPPNSKVILLTSSAASLETSLPPLVEPVNVIIFTSLCVDNTFPTSDPLPGTKLNTPLGKPTLSIASVSK